MIPLESVSIVQDCETGVDLDYEMAGSCEASALPKTCVSNCWPKSIHGFQLDVIFDDSDIVLSHLFGYSVDFPSALFLLALRIASVVAESNALYTILLCICSQQSKATDVEPTLSGCCFADGNFRLFCFAEH